MFHPRVLGVNHVLEQKKEVKRFGLYGKRDYFCTRFEREAR